MDFTCLKTLKMKFLLPVFVDFKVLKRPWATQKLGLGGWETCGYLDNHDSGTGCEDSSSLISDGDFWTGVNKSAR